LEKISVESSKHWKRRGNVGQYAILVPPLVRGGAEEVVAEFGLKGGDLGQDALQSLSLNFGQLVDVDFVVDGGQAFFGQKLVVESQLP